MIRFVFMFATFLNNLVFSLTRDLMGYWRGHDGISCAE